LNKDLVTKGQKSPDEKQEIEYFIQMAKTIAMLVTVILNFEFFLGLFELSFAVFKDILTVGRLTF
jgi:hypothetical protein